MPSQTFNAVADTYTMYSSPNHNPSSEWGIHVQYFASPSDWVYGYVQFDLSAIPINATLTRAVIQLHCRAWDSSNQIEIHFITSPTTRIDLSTLTWNNTPNIGTIYQRSATLSEPDVWVNTEITSPSPSQINDMRKVNPYVTIRLSQITYPSMVEGTANFSSMERGYPPKLYLEWTLPLPKAEFVSASNIPTSAGAGVVFNAGVVLKNIGGIQGTLFARAVDNDNENLLASAYSDPTSPGLESDVTLPVTMPNKTLKLRFDVGHVE